MPGGPPLGVSGSPDSLIGLVTVTLGPSPGESQSSGRGVTGTVARRDRCQVVSRTVRAAGRQH
eukprot:447392-Hanusia_phi.AAC.1